MKSWGETAFAIPIFHPEVPMAKFEEVKFISSFVSHPCETEHPSSPSLKHKPCPSSHPNENFCARDNPLAPTLETEEKDSTIGHERFSFETPHASCSLLEFPKWISLSTTCFHEDHNHISILVCKLFRRMVVDALIYHKYCKSYIFIVALTL